MLKRFLRAWVLEPTRRYQLISVLSCVLLFFMPYWGWTPLWLLWMAGSWLSCRQADRRWLRLLHGGLALFFGAMALVNTGIAFYYA